MGKQGRDRWKAEDVGERCAVAKTSGGGGAQAWGPRWVTRAGGVRMNMVNISYSFAVSLSLLLSPEMFLTLKALNIFRTRTLSPASLPCASTVLQRK